MTLADLYNELDNITEVKGKVRYRAFPPSEIPKPPYICYLVTDSNNFNADNIVFSPGDNIDIELYTSIRDFALENKLEAALARLEIPWTRTDSYQTSEEVYIIIYSITIRR